MDRPAASSTAAQPGGGSYVSLWRAPTAARPIDATVALPGSKSMTNRALLLAALAESPSVVRGALRSRDTDLMVAALRALGAAVDDAGADWSVTPAPLRGPAEVDCGLAGTVLRFLLAAAPLAAGPVLFDGDPRARERPLRPLIAALRQLGAHIDDGERGSLPLTVHGSGKLKGGSCELDSSTSSQFVSALLLSAARTERGVRVTHTGARLPSLPHIEMTVSMLRARGVAVEYIGDAAWHVEPSAIAGGEISVEPDLSNAAPFLAAALLTGGTVRLPHWPRHTTQAGDAIRGLLAEMGASCSLDADGLLTVEGGSPIYGIDVDVHDTTELVPTLAALAAFADSPSKLRGIAHMRGHETDRPAALARELNRLGGDVDDEHDMLVIRPKPLHAGVFRSYDDHRMATTGALLGLAVPGVEVENVATTAKTLPGFVDLWSAMLA